ncbi:hypothetical protein ACLOJK_006103 [Asimina triloba]
MLQRRGRSVNRNSKWSEICGLCKELGGVWRETDGKSDWVDVSGIEKSFVEGYEEEACRSRPLDCKNEKRSGADRSFFPISRIVVVSFVGWNSWNGFKPNNRRREAPFPGKKKGVD